MAKMKMHRKKNLRAHKQNQRGETNPGSAKKAKKHTKQGREEAAEKMAAHVMGVPSQEK